MKIALIADPHLSDMDGLPQDKALDWAINEITKINPDMAIWLGDITAFGSPVAAIRFDEKINNAPFSSAVVPGNSDIRTPNTIPIMENFLFNYRKGFKIENVLFVGMNTSKNTIPAEERRRLDTLENNCDVFLYCHQHPEALDEDSRNYIAEWAKSRNVLMWAHGHIHVYREHTFKGIPTLSIRALDPDKCAGGPSQIMELDITNGEITKISHDYTDELPDTWSDSEKKEFANFLGITCYDIERDMKYAIDEGILHLEWRSIPENSLCLLEKWRNVGGRTFSLHMPSLDFVDGGVAGAERYKRYALNAVKAGADMITVHTPHVLNKYMRYENGLFDDFADTAAEALMPVAEAGIDILVENNHTSFGNPDDIYETPYGCSPIAQIGWRNALNERLGKGKCTLRFDIGHARNNIPISGEYPIGKWFAIYGKYVHSYHLHQTICVKGGKMSNHYPITGWHDGFISYDGFLRAWHDGTLNHAPIILEIREGEGIPAVETWCRLQKLIEAK